MSELDGLDEMGRPYTREVNNAPMPRWKPSCDDDMYRLTREKNAPGYAAFRDIENNAKLGVIGAQFVMSMLA